MGHTLVAFCDTKEFAQVKEIITSQNDIEYNKIPYGRKCDRIAADAVLPYHMTIFHWGKNDDEKYLNALQHYQFRPFTIIVTGIDIMYAEEGSALLYLLVSPGEGYSAFAKKLGKIVQNRLSANLHITLAVSKDNTIISNLYNNICKNVSFPFSIPIERLELYHIWDPVKLFKVFA